MLVYLIKNENLNANKFHLSIPRTAREQLVVQEDGTYGDISTVPLKRGPATSLHPDIEKKIEIFIEDCYHMDMPRSKGKLAFDIQEYLIRNDINVASFANQKPGKDLFSCSFFRITVL